jgi:single-strand DNA-binding protein
MNLNKAMVIGNLTRDPESRTTPQGTAVTSFSVATNMVWTDANGQKQEKPEYHNIVAWRKLAEICAQYLKKGSKVYIEGRLQTRDWEGQDGVKRYRTEIVTENMIMLDKAGSNSSFTPSSTPESANEPVDTSKTDSPNKDSEEEIKIENIPF